ncbi:GNAT family N-acetyltransferase [Thalassiella azotivora]
MGRTTVDVRAAGPQDAASVLRLAELARSEVGHEVRALATGHRDRVTAVLARDDVDVLLAEVSTEPVGLLVLRRGELLPLCGTGAVHVEQLWVAPAWRGRGVARVLLAAAAGAGERCGADRLVCSAPSGDRQTARFLTRLGFAPVVTYRMVSVAGLLRRLAGENPTLLRRSALEQTIARRRRQARHRPADTGRVPAVTGGLPVARVIPIVDVTDDAVASAQVDAVAGDLPAPAGPAPVGRQRGASTG